MPDRVRNIYTHTGGSATTINVTNIPQDAKHLVCYMTGISSSGHPTITYNNLSANYCYSFWVSDNGSTNSSVNASNLNSLSQWGWTDYTYNGTMFYAPYYSENGLYRMLLSQNGMNYYWYFNGSTFYYPYMGAYSNTNSTTGISSIQFTNVNTEFCLSIDLIY